MSETVSRRGNLQAFADSMLYVLLILLPPVSIFYEAAPGRPPSFYILALFYTATSDFIFFDPESGIVLAIVLIISAPAVFYRYHVHKNGREVGSFGFAFKCFVLMTAIYLGVSVYAASLVVDVVPYVTLGSFLHSVYYVLFSLFFIMIPELYWQFNQVFWTPSEQDGPLRRRLLKRATARLRKPGFVIVTSLISVVTLTRHIDTYGRLSYVYVLDSPIFLFDFLTMPGPQTYFWFHARLLGDPMTTIFLNLLTNIVFLHQLFRYLEGKISRRRMIVVSILSLWLFFLVLTSLVVGAWFNINIPFLQIAVLILLKRGTLHRISRGESPTELYGDSGPTPEPTEILVKIPITVIIKSWLRRLLNRE